MKPPLFHEEKLLKMEGQKVLDLKTACTDHQDSFYRSTRPVLRVAQFFGHFFTLHGLRGPYRNMRIKWVSWKTVYAAYGFVGTTLSVLSALVPCFVDEITYDLFYALFFFSICLVISIYILRLSLRWNEMCHDFEVMEVVFLRHGFPKNMRAKFKVLLAAFMFTASVEHFSGIVQAFFRILPCVENSGDILEIFFRLNYKLLFDLTGFSFIMGFIAFHWNLMLTFTWNYLDLLLGIIGLSLSARFKQFNSYMVLNQWQERSDEFWRRARLEWNCLSTLTKSVDTMIGDLIAVSFVNDIFFICFQLLRSLQSKRNLPQKFYSIWSFGFLLARTCFSSFCLAEVNNCSRLPMTVLFSAPAKSYSKEVERFLYQLGSDVIALTGNRLFIVTRGAILTIAGTIITYEIVLLQFNTQIAFDNWPNNGTNSDCDDFD